MTQTIINLGTAGAALNGRNGSTASADSNDARLLVWPGDNAGNYVYLPGATFNSLSVPDEDALDITGDIDIRAYVALDDWTPSATARIVNKRLNTAEISYALTVQTSGVLSLSWSTDGTSGTVLFENSTVAPTVSDGSALWIRTTLDVDNGSGGYDVKFYTSDDGSTWTQLGSTVTGGSTTSIYSGSEPVRVGMQGTNNFPLAAKVYRAQVFNGIDGTTVLDVDTSVISSGAATSFPALTGQTVTINRSASGRKSVAVVSPVWLFGTDDYMEVADNALLNFGASDDFTVLAVVRSWATPSSNGTYIGKVDASGAGWRIRQSGTGFSVTSINTDGTNSTSATGPTISSGLLAAHAFVTDRSAQTLTTYTNGVGGTAVNVSATTSMANTLPVRVGRFSGVGVQTLDGEVLAVAVYRRALTQAEIAQVTAYYQARLS
jgi:hypothetical protein